jgi:hypothetical protein
MATKAKAKKTTAKKTTAKKAIGKAAQVRKMLAPTGWRDSGILKFTGTGRHGCHPQRRTHGRPFLAGPARGWRAGERSASRGSCTRV